jgi:hypothetical protein
MLADRLLLNSLKSSANVAMIIGVMCRFLSLIYHLYMLSKSDYLACTEYHMLFLKQLQKKKLIWSFHKQLPKSHEPTRKIMYRYVAR